MFEDAHRFKLLDVIKEHVITEHEVHLNPTVVWDWRDHSFNHVCGLSLLDRDKIAICFNHHDDFNDPPGSCKFMMALENCHASVSKVAVSICRSWELCRWEGCWYGKWSSAAHQDHAKATTLFQSTLDPCLLLKVTKTSSNYFNRKMFNLLDDVKNMEKEYKLVDPKTLLADHRYHKLGPLAYSIRVWTLCANKEWPALLISVLQSVGQPGNSFVLWSQCLHHWWAGMYLEACSKCWDCISGVQGIYQLSHSESEHTDNYNFKRAHHRSRWRAKDFRSVS